MSQGAPKTSDFFGRRKAKSLKPRQAELMQTRLPQLRLDLGKPCPTNLNTLFANADRQLDTFALEIGFGSGEHLVHRASTEGNRGFFGVEPFVNGMAAALSAIEDQALSNIRLYDQDAGLVLDWLPPQSLSCVTLLYPDPWPKYRHWKRRFVSPRNLTRMSRVLVPGGHFLFASDIEHYVGWTLSHCHHHPDFIWSDDAAKDWMQPTGAFEGWPGTRYERKAIQQNRTPTYLTFIRT